MQMNLDLSGVSELSGKSVVPTGIYNVSISGAEIKEVGNGDMLKIKFSVLDGEEKGATPSEDMWVVHTNDKAANFGKSKLKTILVAAGHSNPEFLKDTNEMLGLKLKISVEEGIQMRDGQPVCSDDGKPYRENTFKGFFKYDGQPTEAPERQITQSPATTPVAKTEPVAAPAPKASTSDSGESFPWNR